jgi:DNA-binding XRE family transcriptional regulator
MSVRRVRGNGGDRTVVRQSNRVRQLREDLLLTKAELARKAGISALTLARIESGQECRVDTKRKIILALGLTPSDRAKVFGARRGRT